MVAPENVSKSEEIRKLQKKLQDLREARERLAREEQSGVSNSNTPPRQTPSTPIVNGAAPASNVNIPFDIGKHGEENRFLSMSKVENEEHFPRILTIAGRVPELTVKEFMETPSVLQNRPPKAGNMFITMLPPGYQGQIIAMPGFEVIAKCKDPVAVTIGSEELATAQLPVADGDDLVLLIERNTTATRFDNTKFYAWGVGDHVKVGWAKQAPSPDTARCLGQVIFGMLEEREDLRKKKSCWEEENETYTA